MNIIHFADLHFSTEEDLKNAREVKDEIMKSIRNILKRGPVLIVVSGDCIDKGSNHFDLATKFLLDLDAEIQNTIGDHNSVKIYCCPGNHDHVNESLRHFNDMYKRLNKEEYHTYASKNTVQLVTSALENLDLILVNSSYKTNDYKYVHINIDHLKDALSKSQSLNKIIVLHHPVINSENSNAASLKNAYEFLLLIQEYEVNLVMHSHIHKANVFTFGNGNTPIVSVGTLLSDSAKNINNQFNLVTIDRNGILAVNNYKYIADNTFKGTKGEFSPMMLWESKKISSNQSINGSSFKDIYERLLYALSTTEYLMNMSVHYTNDYDALEKEIHRVYPEELLKAKEWQSAKTPNNLEFNHGERIHLGENSPFKYVLEALKKDYNNKAVIPLYSSQEVQKLNTGFLPSFTLIQCGFANDTKRDFVLTLYLRAWEISRFALINICELYLICKMVKVSFPAIKNVNISIFAFRSHIHKDFSCFEKADLDIETNIQRFPHYLAVREIDKLVEWLTNKKITKESVIVIDGLEALRKCIQTEIEIENDRSNQYYTNELLEHLDILIDKMKNVKNQKNYTACGKVINPMINSLEALYDNVIECFEKCRDGKG